MSFYDKLQNASVKNNSLLCVGLDPDITKLPKSAGSITDFNQKIINATKGVVCAYKPNSAFFEAHGIKGIKELKATCDYIKKISPDVPIILDFKRSDIGNTSMGYAKFAFDFLGVDAVTVNPYMGRDSVMPFLERKDKGVIILCKTSNEGSAEFQNIVTDEGKLYELIAKNVQSTWNANNNCALVVGATYPDELSNIRSMIGDEMPILVPGIGAQGGNLIKTVKAGINSSKSGLIVNSSRGIIYAGEGQKYYEDARQAAEKLRIEINKARS